MNFVKFLFLTIIFSSEMILFSYTTSIDRVNLKMVSVLKFYTKALMVIKTWQRLVTSAGPDFNHFRSQKSHEFLSQQDLNEDCWHFKTLVGNSRKISDFLVAAPQTSRKSKSFRALLNGLQQIASEFVISLKGG